MPVTLPVSYATLYPVNERNALLSASARGDVAEIDRVTDRLAAQGLCRPRGCEARAAEWQTRRVLAQAARKGQGA